MSATELYPLRFEPLFQYRLWGGRRLGPWMNASLPGGDDNPIGEAWILSDRKDHASPVAEGPLRGKTLTELMAEAKGALLGRFAGRFDRFPLLLKFLDVEQMLSVQVHPRDDQTALIPAGDTGKTEAWVVLEADAKGRIYAGLKPHTDAAVLKALNAKTVDQHLASFRPAAGQAVLIEAGTVHALGDGVMVFEVQENSDTTFRLYDWDHVDPKTGKPRDLQVKDALESVNFAQGEIGPVAPKLETASPARRERVFDNSHFRLERVSGDAPFTVGAEGEPRVIVCIDGHGALEHGGQRQAAERGAVFLLPASVGACALHPEGAMTVLDVAIPEQP